MDEFVFPWLREYVYGLFKEDAKFLNRVEVKVNSLEAELQLIDIFLKNSKAKQKDEMEEELVRQIKEVASEAEDVIAGFRSEVTEYRSMSCYKKFFYYPSHARALLDFGKQTVAIKEKINEIFNNKRKYATEIVDKKRKRQPLAQPADLEESSSLSSQPAFSSKEMQPKRRSSTRLPVQEILATTPSAQQLGLYNDDETQDPQAQEPSLTNLSVVNLQFNNEHRPYSTHAPHGWDPEFDVTQEPQGQDHGIDDTHVPVDRMLDNNEVQTIDEDGNFHVRTVEGVLNIWFIPKGERVVVEINPVGQPIGLSLQKMRRLAGGYARSGNIVGIGADNWKWVLAERKEEIWNMLMMKFYVPPHLPIDEIKQVTFMDFGKNMRNCEARVKKSPNLQDSNTIESAVHATPNVGQFDIVDFECTVDRWLTKEDIARVEKNKQIRHKHNMLHSAGSRSYAYVAHELEKKWITPTKAVIYDVTRTRMDYTFINEDITNKFEEMRALSSQDSAASSISMQGPIRRAPDDAYAKVMDKEEYSEPLPIRSSSHANRSSTASSQVPILLERINAQQEMITALTKKHTRQERLISSLTGAYNDARKLMETILVSQGMTNTNKCPPSDTNSLSHVRVKSSVASRPGNR